MTKVFIYGMGRIGRVVTRLILESFSNDFSIVGFGDQYLSPTDCAYLLKYDTVYGVSPFADEITAEESAIVIQGQQIQYYQNVVPINIPLGELDVKIVIDCSGALSADTASEDFLTAGARRVVQLYPGSNTTKKVVYLINDSDVEAEDKIITTGSCTTQALAYIGKVLNDNYGIEYGEVTSLHAYTNDQATNDSVSIQLPRGRAAAQNIVPTTTNANRLIGRVIPALNGKFYGKAYRVPVLDGSLIQVTAVVSSSVTVDDVNAAFKANSNECLGISEDPIVSSDCINQDPTVIVLLSQTVVNQQMVIISGIYDNERGFALNSLNSIKSIDNNQWKNI